MKRQFLAVLLCLAVNTQAQDLVVTNAKVFRGPGSESAPLSVRVSEGLIVEVGEMVDVGDARVLSAEGAYITPGLIDSGSSLGIEEVGMSTSADDHVYDGTEMSAGFDPLLAYNRNSSLIPSLLSEGVTHLQVRPEPGEDIFAGQGGLVRLDEGLLIDSPRVVYAHLGETGWKRAGKSRAAAMQKLLGNLDEAELYAANRKAYLNNRLRQLSLSLSDLDALADVLLRKKKLAVYVDRAAEIEAVLEALDTYNLDVVLLGAREAWMVSGAISERSIPVVINVMDNRPSSFDRLGVRLDQARILHEAGITVAFMSESIYQESRMLTQSAGVAVAYGLPWQAAMDAITLNPAVIWGLGDRLGSLEEGKDATFILWDGDPFELTSKATHVVIKGEFINVDNRQHMLRDRYRTLVEDSVQPYSYR